MNFIPSILTQFEAVFGTLLYLAGTFGSSYRFKHHPRRGSVDAWLMVCMTWGFCAVTVSILSILKFNIIPTLHLEVLRGLYYAGAFATSLVFFTKNFKTSAKQSKVATAFLVGTMAFIVGEVMVFYLGLSYQAAIFACVGMMIFYCANIPREKNITFVLIGLGMVIFPVYSALKDTGFDIQAMHAKREEGIHQLLDQKNWQRADHQITDASKPNSDVR